MYRNVTELLAIDETISRPATPTTAVAAILKDTPAIVATNEAAVATLIELGSTRRHAEWLVAEATADPARDVDFAADFQPEIFVEDDEPRSVRQFHLAGTEHDHDQSTHAGGGGGSAGAGTKDDPIKTDDVEVAAKALQDGKHVQLKSKRQVSTLVKELAAAVQAAREAEKDPPDINLCNVTVAGSNLFCVESKGIPRVQMPQLSGVPKPGSKADGLPKGDGGEVDIGPAFVEHLQSQGVEVNADKIDARYLKASQNELVGAKVAGIANALESGVKMDSPIFVTSDDYVVDGHHRWAASVAVELGGTDADMNVNVIDSDIITVLGEAYKFAEDWGIPPKAAKPDSFALRRMLGLTTAFHLQGQHDQQTHGSGSGGGSATEILDAHPGRIPLTALGITPAPARLAKIAESTRDDDAAWDDVPITDVPSSATFLGTETDVSHKSVAKVVLGKEPLREGYAPRLYQLDDGRYLIADGHHRLAMHVLMKTPAFEAHVRPLDQTQLAAGGIRRFHLQGQHDQSTHGNRAGATNDAVDLFDGEPDPYASIPGWDPVKAAKIGKEMRARAEQIEPELTMFIAKAVEDSAPAEYHEPGPGDAGELYGYEHRLKKANTIAKKIGRVMDEDGLSFDEAVADIKDANRYTVHYHENEFGERAQFVVDRFREEHGDDNVTVKNTWPPEKGVAYKGVNVQVTTKDGDRFEVQFHTPQSQAVKDRMHKLYEKQRSYLRSDPKWWNLERQMFEIGAGQPTPRDATKVFRVAARTTLRVGGTN